jgi:hypothetical protein
VVGVTDDLIAQYLAQLWAGLRTPPERTGQVGAVVRAHRRPAAVLLAEIGMAAMKLAAIYLLAVSAVGLSLPLLQKVLVMVAAPPGTTIVAAPVDYSREAGGPGASAGRVAWHRGRCSVVTSRWRR